MRVNKKILCYLIIVLSLVINSGFSQFRIVHISDIHVSDQESYVNNSDVNGILFSALMQHVQNMQEPPDIVVASGDISNAGNSGEGMYTTLTQHLYPAQLSNPANGDYHINPAQTIPVYFVAGNHDYYLSQNLIFSTDNLDNYEKHIGPAGDYFIIRQNALLVFLFSGKDQFRPVWEDYNPTNPEGSGLSNGQVQWLRNVLGAHPDKRKIIVMHHPAVHAIGTNADGSPGSGTIVDEADGCIINNRNNFLNICDSNTVDIVLCGHVHQNVVASRNGHVVDENWAGGTRYIQTAACIYRAYRVITVDSDFVYVDQPQQIPPVGISENLFGYQMLPVLAAYHPNQQSILVSMQGDKAVKTGIRIFNSAGQLIEEGSFSGNEFSVNTSGFAGGLYIMALQNETGFYRQKIAVY